jgi:hypothetical protein
LDRYDVPVDKDSDNLVASLRVSPNISEVSQRRDIPLQFILDEIYPYARHSVALKTGVPEEVIEVQNSKSLGGYIIVMYPKLMHNISHQKRS